MFRGTRILIIAGVIAGLAALGILIGRGARRATAGVDELLGVLGTPPDSVEGSVLWGRYVRQRASLFAARDHLAQLVALDSTLVRDSTYVSESQRLTARVHPTNRLPSGEYPYQGPYLRVTPSGWYATVDTWPFQCAVAVGPDTTIRGAPPGTVVCYPNR